MISLMPALSLFFRFFAAAFRHVALPSLPLIAPEDFDISPRRRWLRRLFPLSCHADMPCFSDDFGAIIFAADYLLLLLFHYAYAFLIFCCLRFRCHAFAAAFIDASL